MNRTSISWTEYTSSPLRYRDENGRTVWACVHASAGCVNCYAEALAQRFDRGMTFTAPHIQSVTPYLDEKEMQALCTSKAISGKKVFIEDMSDLFGEWVPDALIDQVFAVMALRYDVTFQVLTKRADRVRAYLGAPGRDDIVFEAGTGWRMGRFANAIFPLPNVWIGVSAEDQQNADERIPLLLETPAAVRFVSIEPMIGPVDLNCIVPAKLRPEYENDPIVELDALSGLWSGIDEYTPGRAHLDWVIIGGESGPHFRHMDPEWARDLVGQCRDAGVAVWFKQMSGLRPGTAPTLDGIEYHEWPRTRVRV